ncbi:MAG: hypothetical protein KDJ80_02695 [Nitratireductor sp.]|nr:hypothetical protein [Nitratireductor sp.]
MTGRTARQPDSGQIAIGARFTERQAKSRGCVIFLEKQPDIAYLAFKFSERSREWEPPAPALFYYLN